MQVKQDAIKTVQKNSSVVQRQIEQWFEEQLKDKEISDPISWIEENISTAGRVSAAEKQFVQIDPHQVQPILACFDDEVREITNIGPQQTGKSASWQFPLTAMISELGIIAWIVYESKEKASRINDDELKPLFESIPKLARWLEEPFSFNKDNFHFPGSTVYFSGAKAAITTFSILVGIAEEMDDWPNKMEINFERLDELRDRLRRHEVINESKLIKATSPTFPSNLGWTEFKKGSQNFWHLSCLNSRCGYLMPSYQLSSIRKGRKKVGGFQYEKDKKGNIKYRSIRLCCPECEREHKEDEVEKMNLKGRYIPKNPSIKHLQSFQWGALAAPRALNWRMIADAINEGSGKDALLSKRKRLANKIQGMPYIAPKINQERKELLIRHERQTPIKKQEISLSLISIDTQDNGFPWICRAVEQNEDSSLLDMGFCRTLEDIETQVWAKDKTFNGVLPKMMIIDEGGHRAKEIQAWALKKPGVYTYKGDSRTGKSHILSSTHKKNRKIKPIDPEDRKRILAKPHHYKAELIYKIYHQPKDTWKILPEDELHKNYIAEVTAVKAKSKIKNGDDPELWEADPGVDDHFFDCEKMWLVLYDFCFKNLPPEQWAKKMPFHQQKSRKRRRKNVK